MRSVKGNKGLLLKKVTKPESVTASRFCEVCSAVTVAGFDFVMYAVKDFTDLCS